MALHAVTGAFGYSGRYLTERLLAAGETVVALTGSPQRAGELAGRVRVAPLAFGDPAALRQALAGVEVLYNTYWVRFDHADFTFAAAEANTRALFAAARDAGVARVVHTSITNPSVESPFAYFRGKARLEQALAESGLSHAVLRPAVLFGGAGILLNNIAWALRRLPLFGVFGDGGYELRPMHVEDFADLCLAAGRGRANETIDAVGPEQYTYRGLVELLAEAIGVRARIVSVSPEVGYQLCRVLGRLVGDVLLTREEIGGLCAGLLASDAPSTGTWSLRRWAMANGHLLGRRYFSELARRRERAAPYERGLLPS